MRGLGDLTHDLEAVILEMVDDHDMQWGEILNIVRGYLEVHAPGAREEYVEGGHPVFYYGPKNKMCNCKKVKQRKFLKGPRR